MDAVVSSARRLMKAARPGTFPHCAKRAGCAREVRMVAARGVGAVAGAKARRCSLAYLPPATVPITLAYPWCDSLYVGQSEYATRAATLSLRTTGPTGD